jgi:hypothetical protein
MKNKQKEWHHATKPLKKINSLSGDGNSDILRLFPVVGDNLPRPPIHRLHTVVEVSGLNQVT